MEEIIKECIMGFFVTKSNMKLGNTNIVFTPITFTCRDRGYSEMLGEHEEFITIFSAPPGTYMITSARSDQILGFEYPGGDHPNWENMARKEYETEDQKEVGKGQEIIKECIMGYIVTKSNVELGYTNITCTPVTMSWKNGGYSGSFGKYEEFVMIISAPSGTHRVISAKSGNILGFEYPGADHPNWEYMARKEYEDYEEDEGKEREYTFSLLNE
jgi:hypothetical protein